jgi:hypothetical protein
LAAANICPDTGLATDYLNHFNEVAMLIEMLPDMPEAIDDITAWRPCTYSAHFNATGFRAKDLAQRAYDVADPELIARFENARAKADAAVGDVQARLAEGLDPALFAAAAAADLFERIALLNAIILGQDQMPQRDEQAAIDTLFA